MKIMIDTNVVIDVHQQRDGYEHGAQILKLSENKKIKGMLTASTITDIYFILGKYIKDDAHLRHLVQTLLSIVTLEDVYAKDVYAAFELPMHDFEDAVLAQCAKRLNADYIVTGNTDDFVNSPVKALKPEEFLTKFFP